MLVGATGETFLNFDGDVTVFDIAGIGHVVGVLLHHGQLLHVDLDRVVGEEIADVFGAAR